MTSTLPPLIQAFSGAIGSASAGAIAYPLDLVATRIQTTSSKKLRGIHPICYRINDVDSIGTRLARNLVSFKAYQTNRRLERLVRWSRNRHSSDYSIKVRIKLCI